MVCLNEIPDDFDILQGEDLLEVAVMILIALRKALKIWKKKDVLVFPVSQEDRDSFLTFEQIERRKRRNKRKAEVKKKKAERFYKKYPNCYYCDIELTVENRSLDHWIPKSRGGRSTFDNIVTSCKKCNEAKGNLTPDELGINENKTTLGDWIKEIDSTEICLLSSAAELLSCKQRTPVRIREEAL